MEKISTLDDPEFLLNCVNSLMEKYRIKERMLEEISHIQLRIQNQVEKIEKKTGHSEWCRYFNNFIDITIAASKKRALC